MGKYSVDCGDGRKSWLLMREKRHGEIGVRYHVTVGAVYDRATEWAKCAVIDRAYSFHLQSLGGYFYRPRYACIASACTSFNATFFSRAILAQSSYSGATFVTFPSSLETLTVIFP